MFKEPVWDDLNFLTWRDILPEWTFIRWGCVEGCNKTPMGQRHVLQRCSSARLGCPKWSFYLLIPSCQLGQVTYIIFISQSDTHFEFQQLNLTLSIWLNWFSFCHWEHNQLYLIKWPVNVHIQCTKDRFYYNVLPKKQLLFEPVVVLILFI